MLRQARILDGRPRTVDYLVDGLGRVVRRQETLDAGGPAPLDILYRFDNRERYDPVNSYGQGSGGGTYTVRTGDTLASIAQAAFGDANLWYLIAQANGLSPDAQLTQGQILTISSGVTRTANNASTFRPYDPARIIGDVLPNDLAPSPTTPQPQAARRRNRCGVFGAILLTVVAVAVTALTSGATVGFAASAPGVAQGSLAAAVVGGALAGAAGAVASQAVGLATGIQDRFSFRGVALAALAGGVGGGVGNVLGNGAIGGSQFLGDAIRGAAGSALTQGVGVATGLQSRFDFAGVATAAVGAGIGAAAGRGLARAGAPRVAVRAGGATAGGVAIAASRSLLQGTSFGDNLVAALPEVIGQTVGGLIADAQIARSRAAVSRRAGAQGNEPPTAKPSSSAGTTTFPAVPVTSLESQPGDIVVTASRNDTRSAAEVAASVARAAREQREIEEEDRRAQVQASLPPLRTTPTNYTSLSALEADAQHVEGLNRDQSTRAGRHFGNIEVLRESFYRARIQVGAIEARTAADLAAFDAELLDIISIGPRTALSLVGTVPNALVTAYDYSQGNISTAEAAISLLPSGRTVGNVTARLAGSARINPTNADRILFGQRRVGERFTSVNASGNRPPEYLAGRLISEVAADLRAGILSPDQLPIDVFRSGDRLVSVNTRSLAALSEAGLAPTRVRIVEPSLDVSRRLLEQPIVRNAPLPGPRVPVTPSQRNLTVIRVIEVPR